MKREQKNKLPAHTEGEVREIIGIHFFIANSSAIAINVSPIGWLRISPENDPTKHWEEVQ
jgi:hypothetical protein